MVGQSERRVLRIAQVERLPCRGVSEKFFVTEPSVSAVMLWVRGFDRALEEGSEARAFQRRNRKRKRGKL